MKSIAPEKGAIIHESLATYYAGGDWTAPIKNLKIDLEKVFDEEREQWANLPGELYRVVRGYISAYKSIDATWKVIAVEHKVEYPISEKHSYVGYIDLIIMDKDKKVWIVDHKTVKSMPEEKDLYMDLQLLMYYDAVKNDKALMEIIQKEGGTLAGFMFNHIKSKPPKIPETLKSGGLSKAKIDTDVATYFETVKKLGLDPKDYEDMIEKLKTNVYFKRMKLPVNQKTIDIIKGEMTSTAAEYEVMVDRAKKALGTPKEFEEKEWFVRNPMKNRCSWDCPYQKLCYAELAGMHTADIIASDYEPKVDTRINDGGEDDGE